MGGEHTAWIITVGNEVLIGRIVNTNAAWLGSKLTLLGYSVERIITVPDRVDDISEEVGRAIARAGVVITTGGLGPTYDDLTLEGVAKAIGARLVLDKAAYEMVKEFYSKRNMELTSDRIKMAYIPEGAKPIPNPVGAAPGVMLAYGGSMIFSLPGVPSEMKSMFERYVEPVLKERGPGVAVAECYAILKGVPESSLAPAIRSAAKRHPRVYLKSHPKGHELEEPVIEVRALASAASSEEARSMARSSIEEVVEYAVREGGRVGEKGCSS
ncbi:MAG: nicotinamide mononucleotide deamidase-related protein [Desulfurococcales archaeon]|nr:nicotinamide mononucleotide deamidase-related protein [Desulfurococcales archaeon]